MHGSKYLTAKALWWLVVGDLLRNDTFSNFLKNHKFPFLLNHFINNQEKNFLYDHYVLQILIKSDDMLHLNESILSQDKLSEKTKDIIKDGTDKVLGLLGLDKKTD